MSSLAPPLAIERQSTAARVADALREQLLSGVFPPGTPMRDVELSARAGVSRTTMREALALLTREGLLAHALHRGTEVARLSSDDVRDIYAARRLIEGAGLTEALAHPERVVGGLERSVAAMAEAAEREDMRRVFDADLAFHSALAAALGVRRLVAVVAGGMAELQLVLSVADRASGDTAEQCRQHRALVESVRHRQPSAQALLERHLDEAEALVCTVLANTGGSSDGGA